MSSSLVGVWLLPIPLPRKGSKSTGGRTFPLHFEFLVYLLLDPLSDLPREGASINSRYGRQQGSLRGHCVYAGDKFA